MSPFQFILFTLTHPSKRLNTCLRLITEKVDQGLKSVKTDNKHIKKEMVKRKASQYIKTCSWYTRKRIYKGLDMLQVVNKETQSLMLTFQRFHILF